MWRWFIHHAEGPYVLPLLALVAFADSFFLPVAVEFYIAALIAAHPKRWPEYLIVAIVFSTLGAAAGYFFAKYLFIQFGDAILHFYHWEKSFAEAQYVLRGHVFVTIATGSLLPLPDKVFVYAAGFLSVHFMPFLVGYFMGRGTRIAITTFLAQKYGRKFIEMFTEYVRWFVVGLIFILAMYAIVHWHIVPL